VKEKMNLCSPDRRSRGQVNQRVLIGIVAVAIVVLLAFFLFWPKKPEPIPEPGRPLETVAPAESAQERGDTAREIIARLKADSSGPDYAEARARAQEFQADGRPADAQLLYFFAARGGDAPAAFDLATFYDPNHHSAASSIVAEPDPFQAYRWYIAARNAGHEGATGRLDALHAWAESASQSGNSDAERLLLQWEQAQ
jgi:TPR repeat protein